MAWLHDPTGKRNLQSLQEQESDLQERIAALVVQEQQALSRLSELQQQAVGQHNSTMAMQQAAVRAQNDLHELQAQLADAGRALEAALSQRDTVLAEATHVEQRSKISQALTAAQSGLSAAGTPREQGQRFDEDSVQILKQQLQTVKRSQSMTEESLAEERRQLQQCKAELATALTVRASYEAATARLQQDLEKLQVSGSVRTGECALHGGKYMQPRAVNGIPR